MACSQVILLILTTLFLSSPTSSQSSSNTDFYADCANYDPDMLLPNVPIEPTEIIPTLSNPDADTYEVTSTPTTPTPTPPIGRYALRLTIKRQSSQSRVAADNLQKNLDLHFGKMAPTKQTPCFYLERSKDDWKQSPEDRLRSDDAAINKFRIYFAGLQNLSLSDTYGNLVASLREEVGDLMENLSFLISDLNAPVSTEPRVQPFGEQCYSTSYNQQTITLNNLQEFLKDYLLRDVNDLLAAAATKT